MLSLQDILCELGFHYELGLCVTQSYPRAFLLYHTAANAGHAVSQYNVGVMYEHGHGVPQSDDMACFWYTKASNQGDDDSLSALMDFKKKIKSKL